MGCRLSCRFASPNAFGTVRLVHLNGCVEDFDHPISVSEVIGKLPPKQFLCTAAQLVSAGSRPLNPETQLQPGHLYFVLPLSSLQDADMSPLHMASVVKRLTARANSVRSDDVSPKTSHSWGQNSLDSMGNSSVSSPGRPERRETSQMTDDLQKSCRMRPRPWKPILDTIREKSFTRRSESDLREMHFILQRNSLDLRGRDMTD